MRAAPPSNAAYLAAAQLRRQGSARRGSKGNALIRRRSTATFCESADAGRGCARDALRDEMMSGRAVQQRQASGKQDLGWRQESDTALFPTDTLDGDEIVRPHLPHHHFAAPRPRPPQNPFTAPPPPLPVAMTKVGWRGGGNGVGGWECRDGWRYGSESAGGEGGEVVGS
ncbi:hypothetical protein LTR66_010648 [Elasticomyces elasticus]|nr:hypothetical protein LTR66_010648 [Elasticomyces elasticus]